MPFYDFFRNLFNIPPRNNNLNEGQNHSDETYGRQDYRNNPWGPNDDRYEEMWRNARERNTYDDDNIRNFNVFTDPLEMHRYFEQQMNEVLKSFGGFFGSGNNNFFGFTDQLPRLPTESYFPSIEMQEPQNGNLRDRFLKPGYENKDDTKITKRDQVLDDSVINAGDLDELLKDKSTELQKPLMPQIRSFGQSISSKTIRRADGSVEIQKTIRDSAGNEENVVTRQIGDKQYTITVRTDKEGRQEKYEDLINMDEKELNRFKDYWNRGNVPSSPNDDLNKMFPFFDQFFK